MAVGKSRKIAFLPATASATVLSEVETAPVAVWAADVLRVRISAVVSIKARAEVSLHRTHAVAVKR